MTTQITRFITLAAIAFLHCSSPVEAFAAGGRPWGVLVPVGENQRRSEAEAFLGNKNCRRTDTSLFASSPSLQPVPADQEGVPTPFVDVDGKAFIECYADSVAVVNGVEYTIGVPCDYAVALCYFDDNQQLLPLELDDPLMDSVYSVAESIVEDEFGDELVLQRTPQTLTLVGELEEDQDEEDEDFEEEDDDDMDADGDEEVEVLLTFDHDGREYNLVRLLDPILLVGKPDESQPLNRILLTPEESDKVMPVLEEMFMEYRADRDEVLP